jgi:hypothetical protein
MASGDRPNKWQLLAAFDLAVSRAVPNVKDGSYVVNAEIPPGTWRVEDTGTCYWERTRADGSVLDNSFVTAAQRIDVQVRSSDGFFNSRECGTWFKVG